jgi:MATE family multidrug resistance protein
MLNPVHRANTILELKACMSLSVPLIATYLAYVAMGFVDTVMIGRLGETELASSALGVTVFSTTLIISVGIVNSVAALVAEAYGAQSIKRIGSLVFHGLLLALILAIPSCLTLWYVGPLLQLLGQDPISTAGTAVYLRAILWGFLPAVGFTVLRNFVASVSHPRPVMVITVAAVGLNAGLNDLLSQGRFGLPGLGLAGIGWASAIVYWVMALTLMGYIWKHKQLRIYVPLSSIGQWDTQVLWQMIRIGVPTGLMFGIESSLFTLSAFMMGTLGTVPLAAHQIVVQTTYVTFMVPDAISHAVTVRVGQLVGAQQVKRAKLSSLVAIVLGIGFMSLTALLFWLTPRSVIGLYLDPNDSQYRDVIRVATALLSVAAIFQIVDGIQVIAAGALRGINDTGAAMLIGLSTYWCIGLSSAYVLGLLTPLGSVGIWAGMALGLASASIVLTGRFYQRIHRLEQEMERATVNFMASTSEDVQ